MNLFTIAILFSGMVGGDSALFVPVSRESGPRVAGSHPGSAGRLDPRQPANYAAVERLVGARPVPSSAAQADRLKSGAAVFVSNSEPARLPVRNVAAIVANPIVGPTGGNPGNLLVLDASKANAKSYAWDVIPLDKDKDGKPLTTILPWDSNGARAIVSSTPGTKTVILAVVDEGGKPTLWQWTIVVSGNVPTPSPDPPKPPPEPPKPELSNIGKISYAEAKKVNRPEDCRKLASAQGGIASAIRAGGLKEPEEILTAWREANRNTVDRQYWTAWGKAVGDEWAKLNREGKAVTAEDFAKILDDVKAGLEIAGG